MPVENSPIRPREAPSSQSPSGSTRGLQAMLFPGGPFYFYPWKAVINHVYGDSYEVGYRHFRVGHRHPVNLGLHFVCLWIQVLGNFATLNYIDETLIPQPFDGIRLFSAISAISWIVYLLPTAAPIQVTLMSAASIFLAYAIAPHLQVTHFEFAAPLAMIAMALVSNYVLTKNVMARKSTTGVAKIVGQMVVWMGVWTIAGQRLSGAMASYGTELGLGVLATLFSISMLKNPLKPTVVAGVLLTRLVSILTNNTGLMFFGYAFQGSLFQGFTHWFAEEEATLLALERQGEDAKLRFEYSHVTFFPNLLFQALYESITGTGARVSDRL